jgi:hypothetical protein
MTPIILPTEVTPALSETALLKVAETARQAIINGCPVWSTDVQ